MSHPTCPQCGSDRVHRSRRRSLMEKLLAPAGGKTSRCHACNSRFVQLGSSLVFARDLRTGLHRVMLAAGVLLAAALVLAVILWIDRVQANPLPESCLAPGSSFLPPLRSC